ncbi:MAG: hypothetical protein ACLFT8_00450 [Desulfovermiculus sp.]
MLDLSYLFTISCARISIAEEEAKVRGFGPQASGTYFCYFFVSTIRRG